MKDLSQYDNIQYLYPLVEFTNYFIKNFNYRIKRNDAISTKISQFFKDDSNLNKIYKQFLDGWYKIALSQVYFDQRKYEFSHSQSKYAFKNQANVSMFLLDPSSDSDSRIVLACLLTLADLQNDIIKSLNINYKDTNDKDFSHIIPLQSIQKKHLFQYDTNKIRKLLVERGLMINYTYGMSKEIIYDYKEIEWTLTNEINCLPLVDAKNMRFFNYQFELYNENVSLISEIRTRLEQSLFNEQERSKIKKYLHSLDNNSLLQLFGSLENILSYLRTINNKTIVKTMTIRKILNEYIYSKTCIDNEIFETEPFSSIHHEHIIDLYELIEECIFDKILCHNMRNELCEEPFSIDPGVSAVKEFIDMILHNNTIAACFRNLNYWIDMLKRLLVRSLLPGVNIAFDVSLHDCVARSDMWKGNVTKEDIKTIEIKKDMHLKHAYLILKGLKAKQSELTTEENKQNIQQQQEEQRILNRPSSSAQESSELRRRRLLR